MTELHIVGWDRFQHYKDRWPPWIKTYTELLANDDYLNLTGHRRSILHGLWLAYAMSHGRLTLDARSLSRRLSLRVTMNDLRSLEDAGFIALQSQKTEDVASTQLAERSNGASPHALARDRGREEAETDNQGPSVSETLPATPAEANYASRQPQRFDPLTTIGTVIGQAGTNLTGDEEWN